MKILHLDTNHDLLIEQLAQAGFINHEDYTSSKTEIEAKICDYDGVVLRSRFTIDKQFLDAATHLKFIGRVGAGLENIDCDYAEQKGVYLVSAPEGNRNAVGEHSLGMLLSLFNKLNKADAEVRQGQWLREANRGIELDGKTVGLIGYGNMGKAFAKKLRGFDVDVIFYDIKEGIADENARQVGYEEFFEKADVVSLHVPLTEKTEHMFNKEFINKSPSVKDKSFPVWQDALQTVVFVDDEYTYVVNYSICYDGHISPMHVCLVMRLDKILEDY